MSKYDDIINLPHPVSRKHPQMSIYNRAAQFAPFAALVGYDEVIKETGRETDKKIELDEYQKDEINRILIFLMENKNILIRLTYFISDLRKEGGSYESVNTSLKKIDIDNHMIILSDNTKIDIDDIAAVEVL